MPQLNVYTNSDAELFVMDAALSRVARSVGSFEGLLDSGLYKLRASRAGTFKEQLIELGVEPQQHYLFIDHFAAIAPIGPMLMDRGRIEDLARAAFAVRKDNTVLVLAHQSAQIADRKRPFGGAMIFPWRATKDAVKLDNGVHSTVVGEEIWSAIALSLDPEDGPFILELRNGTRISRQAVLVAEGWQTRVFLRANGVGLVATVSKDVGVDGLAPFEVSIQMALPAAPVVYSDHWETVEVARSALERGRAIFTSDRLVNELLYKKYDNPIAGLTGLHLFLDAKARSEAGDATYDLAPNVATLRGDAQGIVDEVLVNLTKLLHPDRVAASAKRRRTNVPLDETLLYPDREWPESADLTALRVRAGRCRDQVIVPSPPMFRVSWDVLKANAARDGLTWISRQLWSGTGAAGSAGPYLAWTRGRHSVKRTLQRISDQFSDFPALASLAQPSTAISSTRDAELVLHAGIDVGEVPALHEPAIQTSETTQGASVAGATDNILHKLARSFDLPVSILQER
ncbi:hypothetical protein C3Y89_24470 [Rhizobium sp. UPM1132]|uniref:hypothetical protein n=1 Tax=Rhizobium ruizarguesonis TaxID=2081791 RepID=UPI001445E1CF|nr:hypothetical protein [Rhizobium ruizarguesonis]NKQ73456.1 hypothetical protein [Rhizobium ruizarguesonis]